MILDTIPLNNRPIAAGIVTQVFFLDFTDIQLDLYVKRLFGVDFFIFLHMAIVVLFIQNLSPNKYIGFFLCALYFIIDMIVFGVFEFDNQLLRYGRVPDFIYSNINGFGHLLKVYYGTIFIGYS